MSKNTSIVSVNYDSTLFNDLASKASGPLPYGLTNDYMFRALAQESNASLRHLISALLHIPFYQIVSCEITNPIILGQAITDKNCILDVRVLLNNNSLINIEM